ncbi:MAG TPA: pilus assembly protein TadG-related protein [Alphaproteobacteria bacterium]|nr:pilus assembly protein TadG-related protein [Alphaproteobacteria bacterium]
MRTPFGALGNSGAVAVWMAGCVATMVGIVALSLDLGRIAITDTELKWAADAAALAGAPQLDGQSGARDRARLAATGALTGSGVGLTANGDTFDPDTDAIEVVGVKFLSQLGPGEGTAGDVEATTDADARYIQVVVEQTTINNLFIQVVGGSDTSTVQQSSVAGYGSTICRVPPLMLCNPYEETNPSASLPPGMGILVKNGGGNEAYWGPGNYALLEIPGLPGADAIRDAFASLHGSPVCYDPNLVTTKPGQAVSVNDGINVRLDMYHGVTNGLKSSALHYPAKNVVKGLGDRGTSATKCNPKTDDYDLYTGEGDPAELVQYPRDKCFYTNTCAITGAGIRYGDGQWDKAAYCQINYGDPTCSAVASPTGAEISTRYGFYRAEVESGVVPQQVNEDVKDLCYTAQTWDGLPTGTDVRPEGFDITANGPDRRVLTAAMVNCNQQNALGNLNGHKTVEVAKWVLLFLTEAAGQYGDQAEIFLEVIRELDVENDEVYAHDIVQLYR